MAYRQAETDRRAAVSRPQDAVLSWYAAHRRDLPWRRPDASPWAVLVSEIMLQQTPVARVLPAYQAWLERWPTPAALAAAPAGEAVRQWGRLGYPRRALRLHAAACVLDRRYGGEVPASHADLLGLPGIGRYTAAAVCSFAFGQRHAVLDTNVRRVLARLITGAQFPPAQPSVAEIRLAESLLPADPGVASRWSVALMELGALVCTAARPQLRAVPGGGRLRLAAGRPAAGPGAAAAASATPAPTASAAAPSWPSCAQQPDRSAPTTSPAPGPTPSQRARALDGLVADGLVDPLPDGTFSLPGTSTSLS